MLNFADRVVHDLGGRTAGGDNRPPVFSAGKGCPQRPECGVV